MGLTEICRGPMLRKFFFFISLCLRNALEFLFISWFHSFERTFLVFRYWIWQLRSHRPWREEWKVPSLIFFIPASEELHRLLLLFPIPPIAVLQAIPQSAADDEIRRLRASRLLQHADEPQRVQKDAQNGVVSKKKCVFSTSPRFREKMETWNNRYFN